MDKAPKLVDFLSSLLASVESGKINRDRKCLLCGSKLSDDGLKSIQVRMGRLRYLIRSIDEGSATAEKLLHNIIHTGEYIGGRDIPENYPDWWLETVKKIDLDRSSQEHARLIIIERGERKIDDFDSDASTLITLLIMKNLVEINRDFVEMDDKSEILISLTIGYMAAKSIVDSKKWHDQIPHMFKKEFIEVIKESRFLLDQHARKFEDEN